MKSLISAVMLAAAVVAVGCDVTDTMATGNIKAAIAADSGMKDTDLSVTTNGGVVTLSGTVKSQDQVTIASNLAQRQEDVTKVETNVTVK